MLTGLLAGTTSKESFCEEDSPQAQPDNGGIVERTHGKYVVSPVHIAFQHLSGPMMYNVALPLPVL